MSTAIHRGAGPSRTRAAALGERVIASGGALVDLVDLLGATLVGMGRLLRGGSREARASFAEAFQHAGMGSLPIVGLIGCAAGFVLTLLGTKELGKIGVDVGVARLVGIVVLREIAGLVVGIALAGRVASSYAAEISAARAPGQADALRASGLDPGDVQLAPRVLALVLAAPLLLAYADALAVVGSVVYATRALGAASEHAAAVLSGLSSKHAIASVLKVAGFAFVVALSGCYQGLRSSGSTAATGRAVRRAVPWAVVGVGLVEVLLIFVFKWIRL